LTANACGMACGQRVLSQNGIEVFQSNLTNRFYRGLTPESLKNNMNKFLNEFRGGMVDEVSSQQLIGLSTKGGNYIARIGGNPGHFVVVESASAKGLSVWDPATGKTTLEATDSFAKQVTGLIWRESK
jgi:ABC-type bacteriocin/lantibiotic exporter with double-glycine peptidase domain